MDECAHQSHNKNNFRFSFEEAWNSTRAAPPSPSLSSRCLDKIGRQKLQLLQPRCFVQSRKGRWKHSIAHLPAVNLSSKSSHPIFTKPHQPLYLTILNFLAEGSCAQFKKFAVVTRLSPNESPGLEPSDSPQPPKQLRTSFVHRVVPSHGSCPLGLVAVHSLSTS